MSTITIRADEATEQALAELTEDGAERSAAIREAIQEAARLHRARKVRAEAEALAADPDDRAEIAAVLKDMEDLRAW
ncbi:hypothetical protein GCM10010191_82350 [Actinomadura vinacea]|uniref:Ribbon-helix-helix protein, CopG family n=1 Tax=Actinomadura vinacea TaxID=115336 RepID=A0ABP5XEM3_9ACTN